MFARECTLYITIADGANQFARSPRKHIFAPGRRKVLDGDGAKYLAGRRRVLAGVSA